MTEDAAALSRRARHAAQAGDWRTVQACAVALLGNNPADPEAHFLAGLADRGAGQPGAAVGAFERALRLDAARYDAAIELAELHRQLGRHADARRLLENYEARLGNSPHYLDAAGTCYARLGLHERAGPLFELANRLQPGIERLESNLAANHVYLGRIDEAIAIYERLLLRFPKHQRHHHQLANLRRARDANHIEQMEAVLQATGLPPERNVFLYYALGKELEDLERWDEAFEYYRRAGDAAASVSPYDVRTDVALIDRIIQACDAAWLAEGPPGTPGHPGAGAPIFIVGLPRTGTTLAERILSSHSSVESAGETYFMPLALQQVSGLDTSGHVTAEVVAAAARQPADAVARAYHEAIAYRLAGKPMFIDKYPENLLYLGFISRAFPDAQIVHVRRNTMDTCFALYKQSFFRYAYTLDDLGEYVVAHERMARHWEATLGDRVVELGYEDLVADPEGQIRTLLERLGLPFESACLEFERNTTAAATASAAQVREKIHARSVGKWRNFARQLRPLAEKLAAAGIAVT